MLQAGNRMDLLHIDTSKDVLHAHWYYSGSVPLK